jgi:hypothetical protein
LRTRLAQLLATLDQRAKERQVGLERMPAEDRRRAEAIFAQQRKDFEAKLAEEKAAGIKWPSVDPFDRESIEEANRRVEPEISRLENLDTGRLPKPDLEYREIWNGLKGADARQVEELMKRATAAKLPARYMELLRQRAAEVAASPSAEG